MDHNKTYKQLQILKFNNIYFKYSYLFKLLIIWNLVKFNYLFYYN